MAFVDELLLIVSCPVALPVEVGVNVTLTLRLCPGFNVAGTFTEDAVNPAPLTATEFTVTGAVPLELKTTVCEAEPFTVTFPKERLVAFTLSTGEAAFNCSVTERVVLPVVAVTVADWAEITDATVAVNEALVAVAGTMTELGTATELLLLDRPTVMPPLGADPDRVTLQVSFSAPVMEVLPQLTPLTVGAIELPVPLNAIVAAEVLLERLNCPLTVLAAVGANWTVSTVACPGFSVTGKFPPVTEKPVPEMESELMVSAAVPLEVSVSDFVTAVPTDTFPNASEVALRLSDGTAAFN